MPQRHFSNVGRHRLLILLAVTWFLIVILPCGLGTRSWGQEHGTRCHSAGTTGGPTWGRPNGPDAQEAVLRHSLAIQRADFFPLEGLAPEIQAFSRELLLKALDGEALYTLAGQLKPVSEGFWSTYFTLDPPELAEVERVRAALGPWNTPGLFHADVLVYESARRGQRYASAYVVHVPSLHALIERHAQFFGRRGITTATPTGEVLLAIERCQDPGDRWRGFGLMFGYPEYAIDFFVEAGLHQRTTGEFIERDFRQIPTFTSRSGRFVYAVPKLCRPGPEDQVLERRAAHVLSEYRALRGADATDPIELLRDWMDDGHGYCHPQHLLEKLPSKTDQELDADIAKGNPNLPLAAGR